MDDEDRLSVIFNSETSLTDKFDAVKQLHTEEAMVKVLLDAGSAEIRSYVLSQVDDQDAIIQVIRHDPNSTLRKFAMDKVDTIYYELFEEVVENDPDAIVREQAVIKMPQFYHDQYAKILKTDPDSRVRHRAAQKLKMNKLGSDQLKALALQAIDPYIRRAATFSITDPKHLQEIAIQGDDIQIIQHCAETINDQTQLKSIAEVTEFVSTKLEILPRISDKAFIRDFMEQEENEQVVRLCQRLLL